MMRDVLMASHAQAFMLERMDITRWVQTTTPIITLDKEVLSMVLADAGKQAEQPLNPQINADNAPKNDSPSNTISDSLDKSAEPTENPATLNNALPIQSKQIPRETIAERHISYELEGLCVGEWALIVDMSVLSYDEQSVWLSMKSALSNWATQNEQRFSIHRMSYPMSDDLANTPALAQKCLDGFVFRLNMASDFSKKVAFLSGLSDGIDYFDETIALPKLSDMVVDAFHKKTVWQQLTGN